MFAAQGIALPNVRSISMEDLSAQAADLIDADDADDGEDGLHSERLQMILPEAAAIAGLEAQVPGLIHDDDNDSGSGHLRPSSDSTEDLQRRVATAIASAENAMAMTMTSPKSSRAAIVSTSASPSPSSASMPTSAFASDLDNNTSVGQPVSPALEAQEHSTGAPKVQNDDTQAAKLSLAQILGDTVTEEPMSLVDMDSGSEIAVESVGVSAEDVMALIDNA